MNVLDKLIYNLHTIAEIRKGDRLSTAKEFITIDDSSAQFYYRWKNADSRDKAVAVVCNEVRTLTAITGFIIESYHIDDKTSALRAKRVSELKTIRTTLLGAINGIENLCLTYDDADVSGHLIPLIDEINECVTNITKKLIIQGETADFVAGVNAKDIILQ
jgi:hypothetical protein